MSTNTTPIRTNQCVPIRISNESMTCLSRVLAATSAGSGLGPDTGVLRAGAPPAAATIQRVEGVLGWELTHVYGLTETAPFISVCEFRPEHVDLSPEQRAVVKARQGVELITSGEAS